jgi:CMP-N-acetylneuraminic acid synthetase
MKNLAYKPAPSGSKRVPRKNVRPLAGKPLVTWTIDAVRGLPELCDILVSTDDAGLAAIALDSGAVVPWLRPAELATDTASVIDVAIHALDWYEAAHGEVDGLLLLQATTPFRSRASVVRGLSLYVEHHRRPVLGVSAAASHPWHCFQIDGDRLQPFVPSASDSDGARYATRTQDLPPAFCVNGGFYLVSPSDLRARHSFYGADMVPLVMSGAGEGIDIDTEFDWAMAEAVAKALPQP